MKKGNLVTILVPTLEEESTLGERPVTHEGKVARCHGHRLLKVIPIHGVALYQRMPLFEVGDQRIQHLNHFFALIQMRRPPMHLLLRHLLLLLLLLTLPTHNLPRQLLNLPMQLLHLLL